MNVDEWIKHWVVWAERGQQAVNEQWVVKLTWPNRSEGSSNSSSYFWKRREKFRHQFANWLAANAQNTGSNKKSAAAPVCLFIESRFRALMGCSLAAAAVRAAQNWIELNAPRIKLIDTTGLLSSRRKVSAGIRAIQAVFKWDRKAQDFFKKKRGNQKNLLCGNKLCELHYRLPLILASSSGGGGI